MGSRSIIPTLSLIVLLLLNNNFILDQLSQVPSIQVSLLNETRLIANTTTTLNRKPGQPNFRHLLESIV